MKKTILNFILFAIFLGCTIHSYGQDYRFGIRGGLGYSQFLGQQINDANYSESYSLNNGIHFGVTLAYHINDNFGFRTEVAYNQIGTKYRFESEDAPYVFRFGLQREVRYGKMVRELDINNSYVHVPLMVFVKPFKKLELYGGIYTQFLVIPLAGGSIDFTDPNPTGDIEDGDLKNYSFFQTIDANYYGDEARQSTSNQGLIVALNIDNELTQLSMSRGAAGYFELDADEKVANRYNWFDAGLEGGFSYFVNGSLYLGVTAMYGLLDVTNDKADVDYFELNEFNKYIFREDFDRNFSLQLSMGFKF
jgi:hypothetical protein